jgi:hypothetical protein
MVGSLVFPGDVPLTSDHPHERVPACRLPGATEVAGLDAKCLSLLPDTQPLPAARGKRPRAGRFTLHLRKRRWHNRPRENPQQVDGEPRLPPVTGPHSSVHFLCYSQSRIPHRCGRGEIGDREARPRNRLRCRRPWPHRAARARSAYISDVTGDVSLVLGDGRGYVDLQRRRDAGKRSPSLTRRGAVAPGSGGHPAAGEGAH